MSTSLHNQVSCGCAQQQCAALPVASPWSLTEALDPASVCDTGPDWGDLGL
ncbi:hypothetical protein [Cyanobium sp. ATX 6A2]|uniref:hypothetical protein n=1 Tax=Cyanobium sp. ATX 6A2 TaxID=2823700 RepID=UPI0020CF1448|nr:hypothetical protein [Cyanobium sp. ATX 6A2]